jgi:ribose/xylose/arabinose/galactoside ABC-type transport system permease subunit
MSVYAIMAIGLTCVIISGGIDISVASTMALSALVTAQLVSKFDANTSAFVVAPVSILLPLAVGLICGLINGSLIVGLRMHPFIVTLATLSIFRGVALVLPFDAATLPARGVRLPAGSFTHLFNKPIFGLLLWPIIVTAIVVVLGHVYLRLTVWGRENYAVGGNEEAARFSGIHIGRVKLRVYAISGTLAGLAGLVSLGRFGAVSTNSFTGYELSVVAAAVVGGASLNGGRGTAIGAFLGTLILAMIENGIVTMRANQNYKLIIVGLSILIAVALDQISDIWRKRRAARRLIA